MGRTVRVRREGLPPVSKARLRELEALADKPVDVTDIPEADDAWIDNAVFHQAPKKQVTVRFDRDIIDFFKAGGRGYQTRMNAVLRAYMNAQKAKG